MSATVHVFPLEDLIEHDTESDECLCGPSLEAVQREDGSTGWMLTHHALDGREFAEHDYTGPEIPKEAP